MVIWLFLVGRWVYGSRARGEARPKSDLDMVVFADSSQSRRVYDLKEAFEESNLPFRVDAFVWDSMPEQFRERVRLNHVVLVAGRARFRRGLRSPPSPVEVDPRG